VDRPFITVLLQKAREKEFEPREINKSSWSCKKNININMVSYMAGHKPIKSSQGTPPYSRARSSPGSCNRGAKFAAKVFNRKAFEPHLFNSRKSPPRVISIGTVPFFLNRKPMQLLERLIRWHYFIPIRCT
jgi:hypothetical protein